MKLSADKIAKIRALAERGATAGERAAAREALKRMGALEQDSRAPVQPQAQPGVTGFGHIRAEDLHTIFGKVGLTDEEMQDIITQVFSETVQKSTAKHHHGRVWFDRT